MKKFTTHGVSDPAPGHGPNAPMVSMERMTAALSEQSLSIPMGFTSEQKMRALMEMAGKA